MAVSSNISAVPRRTAPREVRREQLIRATIESIAVRGLSGTTMAHVTDGANLSLGTANYHFTSKELLFVETLKYLVEQHRAQYQRNLDTYGSSAKERLLALIDASFHPDICNRKQLSVWFAFFGEARYRKAYRDACEHVDVERLAEVERLCRVLIADGNYIDIDPEAFARSLEAFIDGLWLNMLIYRQTFSREEARSECLAFLAVSFPRHFWSPASDEA